MLARQRLNIISTTKYVVYSVSTYTSCSSFWICFASCSPYGVGVADPEGTWKGWESGLQGPGSAVRCTPLSVGVVA